MRIDSIPINLVLEKVMETGGILVDIRSRQDFLSGHIPMAINVPQEEIEAGNFRLPKNRLLIIYCERGMHSSMVCRYLARRGYMVLNTIGGIECYRKALTAKH